VTDKSSDAAGSPGTPPSGAGKPKSAKAAAPGGTKEPASGPSSGNAARRAAQRSGANAGAAGTRSGSSSTGRLKSGGARTATREGAPRPSGRSDARKRAQRASTVRTRSPRAPGALSPRMGLAVAIGALVLVIANLPKLSTSDFMPQFSVLLVLGAAGLCLLVVRAMGRAAGERTATETWAARFAIAFVVASLISALVSVVPGFAIVGQYQHGTGWLFILSLAGCWALGTGLSGTQRDRLEFFLIAGAIVNAGIAVLQQFIGLSSVGIPEYANQPDGLLGNPVFLGALMAAALVLIAPRFFAQPRTWWWAVVIVAFALGICAERFPAILAFLVVAWFMVGAWRHRAEAPAPPPPFRTWWQPSVVFAGGVFVAVLVGSLLARAVGGVGVVSHTASSTGTETYGQRFDVWSAAVHALADKPVFGWGPGQFQAATASRLSLQYVHQFGLNVFPDAHDIFVEFTTTTGLLGLVCFVGWLVFALWHRTGYLFGFALVILASELVEPLNPAITGVAFLALGGAALNLRTAGQRDGADSSATGTEREKQDASEGRRPLPTWLRTATFVVTLVAVVPAGMLLIGDLVLQQSYYQSDDGNQAEAASTAKVADTFLFDAWPEPATLEARADFALGSHGDRALLPSAIQLAVAAAERDPTDSVLWATAAEDQAASIHLSQAYQSALKSQQNLRYDPQILNLLGEVAADQHKNATAISWFDQSLKVVPAQSNIKTAVRDMSLGCTAETLSAAHPDLRLSCPPGVAARLKGTSGSSGTGR
jgi:O-antigen ligase